MRHVALKLLLALVVLGLMSSAATAAPQLTIPESIFNFGYVPQNSKVTTKFWLYSTGDEMVKILKVVPG